MNNNEPLFILISSTNKNVRRGGIPTYIFELKNYLDKSSLNYVLLEIGNKSDQQINTINYSDLNTNFFTRAWRMRRTLKRLKKSNPNYILAINYWRELIFSLDIVWRSKMMMHFHGPAYLEAKLENKSKIHVFLAKRYELLFYKRARKIICLSHKFKNLLIENYGVNGSKIDVIPFGFNTQSKRIDLSKVQKEESAVFRIICVRRLVRRVGVDLLIQACVILNQKKIDFTLDIIGEGPLSEELKQYVREQNLSDKITFYGEIDDTELLDLTSKADLAVMPTRGLEGFGIATVESLFNGVPVMATRIGGNEEILCQFSEDLLVDEAKAEKIAEKLELIITKQIHLPDCEKCQQFTIEKYDIEFIGPQIVEKYLDVVI